MFVPKCHVKTNKTFENLINKYSDIGSHIKLTDVFSQFITMGTC